MRSRCLSVAVALLAAVALVSAASGSVAAQPSGDEAQVRATLAALSRGVEKQDLALLRSIFHDDVSYGHSTGIVQTKAEVIEVYRARKTEALKFNNPTVRIIGSTALVRAEMISSRYRDDSKDKLTNSASSVLWVFVKGSGPHGWQVIARQNFRSE